MRSTSLPYDSLLLPALGARRHPIPQRKCLRSTASAARVRNRGSREEHTLLTCLLHFIPAVEPKDDSLTCPQYSGETRVAAGFWLAGSGPVGRSEGDNVTRRHSFDAVRQCKGSGGTAHVEEQSFGSVPTPETRGLEEGKRVAALTAVLAWL
jgi:hypothetical protein